MNYFFEPAKAIYLRDVSKTVSNHFLKRRNYQDMRQLKNMKYSNENMAHEMRAPIGSIVTIIDILLATSKNKNLDMKRACSYYKSIKFQAQLLLHFVNDLLDYRMIKKQNFKRKITKFNPTSTFKNIVDMFKDQAKANYLTLQHSTCCYLDPPNLLEARS